MLIAFLNLYGSSCLPSGETSFRLSKAISTIPLPRLARSIRHTKRFAKSSAMKHFHTFPFSHYVPFSSVDGNSPRLTLTIAMACSTYYVEKEFGLGPPFFILYYWYKSMIQWARPSLPICPVPSWLYAFA